MIMMWVYFILHLHIIFDTEKENAEHLHLFQ